MRYIPTFLCAVFAAGGACAAWALGSLWVIAGAPPVPLLPFIVLLLALASGGSAVMTYELVRRLLARWMAS
jgi:hypothetical protein